MRNSINIFMGENNMKIYKIQIENFRLLKNFSIDIENELSLVVGKNNTGKTSILSALDKFIVFGFHVLSIQNISFNKAWINATNVNLLFIFLTMIFFKKIIFLQKK